MNLNRSYNMRERERDNMISSGRTLGMVIKEKDEELALFLEMRKREKEEKEKEREKHGGSTDLVDPMQELNGGAVPLSNKVLPNTTLVRKAGIDDFLNSENDKNDYDWLLTPPGTPLFPSSESQTTKSPVNRVGTPKSRPTALKSKLANPQEPPSRGGSGSNHPSRATSSHSLTTTRRPSSSGGPTSSRPATPTGRTTLSTHSTRPSRPSTPTSRPILPSRTVPAKPIPTASKPASRSTTPSWSTAPVRSSTPSRSTAPVRSSTPSRSTAPVRSSTPSRSTAPVRSSTPSRSTAPVRSSTPSRSTAPVRSSTPSRTSSVPNSQPKTVLSRSSTPTRRDPSNTTATTTNVGPTGRSAPPVLGRSLTGASKASSVAAPPARAASPTVRSRPWKPSEMPGFSLDAPPNLRTSLPSDRPSSASRGRPGAPSARSASVDTGPKPNPRMRRQSCSPSRGRAPNGVSAAALVSSSRRGQMDGSIETNFNSSPNPVAIGNKMVERVVHMRRLAPLKQGNSSHDSLTSNKPALSPDGSSGFGRNLSKKSLEMALRHMDIRKSMPNNLRPLMTNIPASSMYSVRSGTSGTGPTRSRHVSVSDSPLATSSNASSEPSVNNLICLEGTEMDEDFIQQPIGL